MTAGSAQKNKPIIVLTGGGTAGHVMPHLAIVDEMIERGWRPIYIASNGLEKGIVEGANIQFFIIPTGKLRRYFSLKNFTDIFRIVAGVFIAFFYLLRLRPKVVFSKGGFVSVPVCVAAWALRIPVVTHESDMSPGLATKLIAPFAQRILCTFSETLTQLDKSKAKAVGTPVRKVLFQGLAEQGYAICGLKPDPTRPVLLVMGGSQGAQAINDALSGIADSIFHKLNVVHLTGKGKATSLSSPSYKQFEYVGNEMPHLLAMADLVISRAGANSIFELLYLQKPMILIPLGKGSRGDQILNANSFVERGFAIQIRESNLNSSVLLKAIEDVLQRVDEIKRKQSQSGILPANDAIMEILQEFMQ
jgi:UDP-N-acetylglucosamine--N-acetylmuramyl-(pentapeptide) pyrophosphoryl-undecaprenol N-acetylglucosamine transferase